MGGWHFDGRDVVCVGFNDWDNDVWTNQHHLMSRIAAAGARVLFIESLGLRRPHMGSGRDLKRLLKRLRRGLGGPAERGNVIVLSPLVVPLHSSYLVRRLNAWLLRTQVRRVAERMGLSRPILWGYVPQAEVLVDALDPELVVYHCVDDIAADERIHTDSFVAAEGRFAARADLVLASAPSLDDRMRRLSQHVLYAPNVADTRGFAAALEPGPVDASIASLPSPRIVFVGAISATKVDFELVRGIAALRPAWSFAMVGPIGLGDPTTDVSSLVATPNVHLVGARSQAQIPTVLRACAAGIIPYRKTELTSSIFPMKVYEYLAAGLGVVATSLPSLTSTTEVLKADTPEEMVAALDRLIAEDSEAQRRARSDAVQAHSWEERLVEITAALGRCAHSS